MKKQATKRSKKMLDADEPTATLDKALTAAEDCLRELLLPHRIHHDALTPQQIADDFAQHINTHLAPELANIRAHGHRNDDPNDDPTDTPEESEPIVLEVLKASMAALRDLLDQVHQMKGMFTDDDETIADAIGDAEDAAKLMNYAIRDSEIKENMKNKVRKKDHLAAAAPKLLKAAADLLSARDRANQSLRDALRQAVLEAGGEVYSKS